MAPQLARNLGRAQPGPAPRDHPRSAEPVPRGRGEYWPACVGGVLLRYLAGARHATASARLSPIILRTTYACCEIRALGSGRRCCYIREARRTTCALAAASPS